MRTEVCAGEVVAPPISSGIVNPWRCISCATCTISSSDGVIRPDSPIMSADSARAVSRIRSAGTITPRSTTSKLLHWSTTPTMFLPMSWTSPLTVAMMILPLLERAPPCSRSMKGTRCATARFMTRADFTTCGRNILPAPNRSPTTFMPSISGPSMTSSGRAAASRASSTSAMMNSSMPLISACSRRLPTGHPRQARSSARRAAPSPRKRPATSSRRSVASGLRFRITSSQHSRSSGAISS